MHSQTAQSPGGPAHPVARYAGIAESLLSGQSNVAVLLGNLAQHHPQAALLHRLAPSWRSSPVRGSASSARRPTASAAISPARYRSREPAGLNAQRHAGAAAPRLPAAERRSPSWTATTRAQRMAAMHAAEFVVAMSRPSATARSTMRDVLLPIAPFTETAGTFVNTEGRLQSFLGVVRPLGETRPALESAARAGQPARACPASSSAAPRRCGPRRCEVWTFAARLSNVARPRCSARAAGNRHCHSAHRGGADLFRRRPGRAAHCPCK